MSAKVDPPKRCLKTMSQPLKFKSLRNVSSVWGSRQLERSTWMHRWRRGTLSLGLTLWEIRRHTCMSALLWLLAHVPTLMAGSVSHKEWYCEPQLWVFPLNCWLSDDRWVSHESQMEAAQTDSQLHISCTELLRGKCYKDHWWNCLSNLLTIIRISF